MKKIYAAFLFASLPFLVFSQTNEEILPRYMTDAEKAKMDNYVAPQAKGIANPPPFENLRNMAEWEEIQAITLNWEGFPSILKQITRAAIEETKVIIFSENPNSTANYLEGSVAGGPVSLENVEIVESETNTIWIRDFGANTVYGNRVDTLLLVDWIYNRPRPDDDLIPEVLAEHMGLDLYTTTQAPNDLVHTGGNFMSDGQGIGFSSELVLEENGPEGEFNVTIKDEEDVNAIMEAYQGINPYVLMTVLPYDIINHIDMHMKLLDEETLLVGEYPDNIADGPQINANIDYVLNNFLNYFGEDYEVVRIPMPDSPSGLWPDDEPLPAFYRTYTNGVFVNKTFIYPSYREEYDTTAARIYEEQLPGYTLVPIDCDNAGAQIIALAGAIHCITHSVGVNDPLLIVHNDLEDTENTVDPYEVIAEIEHRSGIANATLHWRIQGEEEFNTVAMTEEETPFFNGLIPAQQPQTVIEYYVSAEAENGKTQVRPIVAPEGLWSFKVLGEVTSVSLPEVLELRPVYPNPAGDLASIPILAKRPVEVQVYLTDLTGKKVREVYRGNVRGDRRLSVFTNDLASGVYQVVVEGDFGRTSTPLMVR